MLGRVCVCVCVCMRKTAREKEIQRVVYVRKGGYSVYKRLNTGMIVDPRALHVHLSSQLRCVCVCVCECLLTTSPVSVGPLQRLGSATVTDAPDCQLVSSVKTTS